MHAGQGASLCGLLKQAVPNGEVEISMSSRILVCPVKLQCILKSIYSRLAVDQSRTGLTVCNGVGERYDHDGEEGREGVAHTVPFDVLGSPQHLKAHQKQGCTHTVKT